MAEHILCSAKMFLGSRLAHEFRLNLLTVLWLTLGMAFILPSRTLGYMSLVLTIVVGCAMLLGA